MPKFNFEVVARGTITVEADDHEDAARILWHSYSDGDIISQVENTGGWREAEVQYE